MSIIEWEKDESVAVITMTNGENRHNPVFVAALLDIFDEIEKDEMLSSVVITSSDPKNWSQGIDLKWMTETIGGGNLPAVKEFMYDVNKLFKRILLYPMPVIAAINGHAFGNGAMLASTCDFRFMKADKGFYCFPEVDISIPFLPGMVAIIKKAFPSYKREEAILMGKRMGALELEASHVITKACANAEELMKETLAFAKNFSKKRPIFGELKKRFNKEIIEIIDKEDPVYLEPLNLLM